MRFKLIEGSHEQPAPTDRDPGAVKRYGPGDVIDCPIDLVKEYGPGKFVCLDEPKPVKPTLSRAGQLNAASRREEPEPVAEHD